MVKDGPLLWPCGVSVGKRVRAEEREPDRDRWLLRTPDGTQQVGTLSWRLRRVLQKRTGDVSRERMDSKGWNRRSHFLGRPAHL